MMKIKTTFKYVVGALVVLAMVATFAVPSTASADYYDDSYSADYGFDWGGYDYSYDEYTPMYSSYDDVGYDYSYDEYTPMYSSYDVYSTPNSGYDYSYDEYTPMYSSYDYYQPTYESYSTPSYYPSYSTPSYAYQSYAQPQSRPYSYTPAPSYSYQLSQPAGSTNVNDNSSISNSNAVANNTNVNNNNNVNNNPINIVINGGLPVSGTTYNPPVYNPPVINPPVTNNLTVYCVASPTTATVGQNVVWTAYATGGSYYGGYSTAYTYSWTGSDGLSYGNAQAIQKTYATAGLKTASVTVYANGYSQTANCSMTVTGGAPVSNVTVIREPNAGTPVSGVFLSQVPATGISFGWKVALFLIGLLMWSAYFGYVMVSRKKRAMAAVNASTGTLSTNASAADRINQFKLDNMRKKGLIQ